MTGNFWKILHEHDLKYEARVLEDLEFLKTQMEANQLMLEWTEECDGKPRLCTTNRS